MKRIIILLTSYSVWILTPFFLIIKTMPFSEYNFYAISIIAGSLAFSIYSFNVLLISRIRFIEKRTGLDTLFVFHGIAAVIATLFTLAHGIILKITKLASTGFIFTLGLIALILFGVSILFAIIFLTKGKLGSFYIIQGVRHFLKNIFALDYEKIKIIHNANIVILFLAFLHVIYIAQLFSSVYSLTCLLQFLIAVSSYIYLKIIKFYLLKKNPFIVSEVIQISNNITTVKLNTHHFSYLPGQFGYIRFIKSKVKNEEHPFTLSSSPHEDFIAITVKAIGDFSSSLRLVNKGDIAIVDGPYGVFSYTLNYCEAILFFAGGIGITPFLSMIRHIAFMHKKSKEKSEKLQQYALPKKIILFWSVKRKEDLIYLNELTLYQNSCGFEMKIRLTEEKSDVFDFGKFTYEIISEQINTTINVSSITSMNNANYYICGPYFFSESIRKTLKRLKIAASTIKQEFFV